MLYVAVFFVRQLITIKLCTKFQNPTQVVADKSLTEIIVHMYYIRVKERKNEKLKKEGKMRISILFSCTQKTLPT